MCVSRAVVSAFSIRFTERPCPFSVPETGSDATDLDLNSFHRGILDARMRREVRIPDWYLLLVAVLGTLSGGESLLDLERFARRHHALLGKKLACLATIR